ncbi:hypothetical protein E2320_006495 [Naja naja]|nr:hypothetical protein E2320_006495 [Naja naja]
MGENRPCSGSWSLRLPSSLPSPGPVSVRAEGLPGCSRLLDSRLRAAASEHALPHEEALALDPDHVEARLLLKKMTKEAERSKDCAVTLAIKGNLKGALLKINRAINYNPLDEKYFLFRHPPAQAEGLQPPLTHHLRACGRRHQRDPRLRHRIAWLSNESGLQDFREKQYVQAETHFSCAVDNDPWEVKYYLNRAKARVRTLMSNLFPGESKESLLDSKVGDLTKTRLDRKLKSFPGEKALQRPLKFAGSEPPTNIYVQIEDQKAEKKEEANQELKEAHQNKPTLESKIVWVDSCTRLPPKDCPKEPYCWRKF